jgi:hypothetical protein
VCWEVEPTGEVVLPRAAGDSPVDTIAGEVYLALEDCYMTTPNQGRRTRRPKMQLIQ